jgi:hypothetical protein
MSREFFYCCPTKKRGCHTVTPCPGRASEHFVGRRRVGGRENTEVKIRSRRSFGGSHIFTRIKGQTQCIEAPTQGGVWGGVMT